MRKTILMLINGFGVEKNGSASIYSSNLMPNLDAMTKETLFGSLNTSAGDYNNAYRLFSIPTKGKNSEDEIDTLIENKKLDTNVVLESVKNSITDTNKLHFFYMLEDDSKLNQIREFLKILNPNKDKKIFVHLVLTSPNIAHYKSIIKIVSKLSFELTEYCKVGMVVGKNNINSDDLLRAFYREYGEHWNESTKKFEIMEKELTTPENGGVFIINGGFALKEGDSVLFMNYSDIEMKRFYDDFTKIKTNVFSLYKISDTIPNMFVKSNDIGDYFALSLEKFGIKVLVMTDKNRVNDINYYLNGMNRKKSTNIGFAVNNDALFTTKESVIGLVESSNFDGIIIDYDIGMFNKVEDIKASLTNIDKVIGTIKAAAKEKDYTFIVSSLYGMHAPVTEGVVAKVVDFSGKVPCIYQNNTFTKGEYSLNGGNTFALAQTYLTNIDDEVRANKLVHRLSKFEKMLSKK